MAVKTCRRCIAIRSAGLGVNGYRYWSWGHAYAASLSARSFKEKGDDDIDGMKKSDSIGPAKARRKLKLGRRCNRYGSSILVIAPILLPMFVAALCIFVRRNDVLRERMALGGMGLQFISAIALLAALEPGQFLL